MVKYVLSMIGVLFFSMFACNHSPVREAESPAEVIALINCRLIDGTGAAPVKNGVLVISSGRISAVGSRSEVTIPAGARVLDVAGASVLPGFFNCHVHSGYSESNLKAWARSGVTTVRDLGATYTGDLFVLRDQLCSDNRNARLVSAGPLLTVPGGYPGALFDVSVGYPLKSLEEIKEKVTTLLDDGVDMLKLTLESGALWRKRLPGFTPEEAAEIVKLAHRRGKKVSAHILVAQDLARAVAAGVDDIAHMAVDPVNHDLVKQIADQGIYWVPTLELFKCTSPKHFRHASQNLKKFLQAGGRVALGTDFDGYYCQFQLGMPIKEMRFMRRAGMNPMQIIVAGTKHAAHVCGLEDQLGTLTIGKIADVIVVKGNPLKNIKNLANVRIVIRNGQIIKNDL